MDVIAGGKLTDNELLDKMVHELAERNGKYVPVRGVPGVVMYGNVVEAKVDDYHFVVRSSPSLQISCNRKKDGVLAATFVSPMVITPSTRPAFVEFVNKLNDLNTCVGRFQVDDRDLLFQSYLPYHLIRGDHSAASRALFEEGVAIFETLQIPIEGLARRDWSAADGLRFLDELYTRGYIYDEDWT